MAIYAWNCGTLPAAKAYAADGVELKCNGLIFRIDTVTGNYEYHKRNADGQCYVEHDEIASDHGWVMPPIRIEWSRNRFIYRVLMWWYRVEIRWRCRR